VRPTYITTATATYTEVKEVEGRTRFCSFDFGGAECRRRAPPDLGRCMVCMAQTGEGQKCDRLPCLMEPLLQQLRDDAVKRNRTR
jgi:hypothetical protein